MLLIIYISIYRYIYIYVVQCANDTGVRYAHWDFFLVLYGLIIMSRDNLYQ